MKTRLILLISLTALALIGFTTALAGGFDFPLSSKSPADMRALAAGQAIESNVSSTGKEELDRYQEQQPLSIYGDSFVHPDGSAQSSAEIAGLDRDVSPI